MYLVNLKPCCSLGIVPASKTIGICLRTGIFHFRRCRGSPAFFRCWKKFQYLNMLKFYLIVLETQNILHRQFFIKIKSRDKLVVCKLDRFCRSAKEGLECIEKLLEKNVTIHILNMGLIDNSPIGKLIVTNLLAFVEFERAMIVERTQAGKAIAKKRPDFRERRPKKYTKKQLDYAMELKKIILLIKFQK